MKDVSFELRAGEILGFAGLEGSGIDVIFDVLFGLRSATSGSIRLRASGCGFSFLTSAIG